jgi:hypothetical protein
MMLSHEAEGDTTTSRHLTAANSGLPFLNLLARLGACARKTSRLAHVTSAHDA